MASVAATEPNAVGGACSGRTSRCSTRGLASLVGFPRLRVGLWFHALLGQITLAVDAPKHSVTIHP